MTSVAPDAPTEERLDRAAISLLVRETVAEVWQVDLKSVTEASPFLDGDDHDSLAAIQIVEALEEKLSERKLSVHLSDEVMEDLRNVRDAVDAVCKALGL
jgi:acyl carrier protein